MAAVLEFANVWKTRIRGIFQQTKWIVSMTVVGGIVGGPLGALVGTIFGAVVDYIIPDDYHLHVEALKSLSDEDKRELVEAFKTPLVEALNEPVRSIVQEELDNRQ